MGLQRGVEMGGSSAVTGCGDCSPADVVLPSDDSSLSALGLACAFVRSNDLGVLATRRRAQVLIQLDVRVGRNGRWSHPQSLYGPSLQPAAR